MKGYMKELGPTLGLGVVEAFKALVLWARERREKRERDLAIKADQEHRHVERRDLSNDPRPR